MKQPIVYFAVVPHGDEYLPVVFHGFPFALWESCREAKENRSAEAPCKTQEI